MPDYPGRFTGTLIHSKDYEEPRQLRDKRVLVIGGGNSGCDIACEGARVAASCDWSLRSGYWFLPKIAFGVPLTDLPIWNLPEFMQRAILRMLVGSSSATIAATACSGPIISCSSAIPAFGTDVLNYLRQGRIKPRPDIARFAGTKVHFTDGSVGEYDVIVAATGFNNQLPVPAQGARPGRERRRAGLRRRIPRGGEEPLHRRLGAGAQRLWPAVDAGGASSTPR